MDARLTRERGEAKMVLETKGEVMGLDVATGLLKDVMLGTGQKAK